MYKIFSAILLLFVLSSCVSNKRTVYFQGEPAVKSDIYKLNNEPYKIQVGDVLLIDIKSINPQMVSLFQPNVTTTAGSINGYTLDRHGNIRLPYLGELNVLGYTVTEVREKIENGLKLFIKNTDGLFVEVKQAGIKFIVTGEVEIGRAHV